MCFFLSLNGASKENFWVYGERAQKKDKFSERGDYPLLKLWYRGKEVLINKVFYLNYKENIKKTMEAITPIVGTLKLCASKHSIKKSQGQCKN